MHIAFLIPTLDQIGGAESQVLLLADGLARRGWRVTLVTLSDDPESSHPQSFVHDPSDCTTKRLSTTGVTRLSLGMRKAWVDPRGWRRYWSWAKSNPPDVVHAHLPHAVWFARFVRLIVPVPLVVETIHTAHATSTGSRILTQQSNWLSNRTTCVSEAVARSVLASSAIPERKLTVLPNGIQLGAEWNESLDKRDELCRSSPGFHWIAVGRLAPVKDYPTLLRAFAAITRNEESEKAALPRLTVAGAGPEERALRVLANDLQIAGQVHFAGFQCDVLPLLAVADAFVLSSRWEGLPIGVLEAQAAGLPVVATDGPGTSHALIDGQTGFLVPVGDVDQLAAAMNKVMAMPCCQRRRMGKMGHQFVTDHYSLEAVLDQWENVYRELLDGHFQPSRWARKGLRQRASGEASTTAFAAMSVPDEDSVAIRTRQSANGKLPARLK